MTYSEQIDIPTSSLSMVRAKKRTEVAPENGARWKKNAKQSKNV